MRLLTTVVALVAAVSLQAASPSSAAKAGTWVISGKGVGPYVIGTTGSKALKSSLYTKPSKATACGSRYTVPPAAKGAAGKALYLTWDYRKHKDWTKSAKLAGVGVFKAKAKNKSIATKEGITIGSTVADVEAKVSGVQRTADLAKYQPLLAVRSGKRWINFWIDWGYDYENPPTSWDQLAGAKVTSIYVGRESYLTQSYFGSGGC
ncbi:MAG: hypothetical protein QM572_07615 [Nocardioides sp.]|uniref:hypothetical protein n=1 Tax=Nocardioides sp. TaxID=35761 RepID=UPI0039E4CDB2